MAGGPPLSRGDRGDTVTELHHLLSTVGYPSLDREGEFDSRTVSAIEAFQRAKSLPVTGICDDLTWQRLREATWHLGGRLLYLARPHLRGDDVADLQSRLAQLGFNPGRVDGIFGLNTETALREFQHNAGLDESGTLTRATWNELLRLGAVGGRRLVTEAREAAGLDIGTGPVVVTGDAQRGGALAVTLRERMPIDVREVYDEPSRSAQFANLHEARVVLSLATSPSAGIGLHFWSGFKGQSLRGQALAERLAAALTVVSPAITTSGMALPLLRETRMTCVVVEYGAEVDHRQLNLVITEVIDEFMHSSTLD
jgi:N-acetylmuramoyl-L-alanine amidase